VYTTKRLVQALWVSVRRHLIITVADRYPWRESRMNVIARGGNGLSMAGRLATLTGLADILTIAVR
jgi:hypothetical protein